MTAAGQHHNLAYRGVGDGLIEQRGEAEARLRQVVTVGQERDGDHRAEQSPGRVRADQAKDVRSVLVDAPHGVDQRCAADPVRQLAEIVIHGIT